MIFKIVHFLLFFIGPRVFIFQICYASSHHLAGLCFLAIRNVLVIRNLNSKYEILSSNFVATDVKKIKIKIDTGLVSNVE